jgi:hypothetical protein
MESARLKLVDLQRMCDEREGESLTLELKPCNELRVGSDLWEKGKKRPRILDDVLGELTRDVTAFLNSAGGTLIYGIRQDNQSRAKEMDEAYAFRKGSGEDDVSQERVADWLRAHVQPRPTVDVYPVEAGPGNPNAWYLVLEIPQGEVAYMAKDHRFHKRVSASVQLMEQYEVVDVMNRMRGAALEARLTATWRPTMVRERPRVQVVTLDVEVTSRNYVASEYGALRLTSAWPVDLRGAASSVGHIPVENTHLRLPGESESADAQTARLTWGLVGKGTVVLSGEWVRPEASGVRLEVPSEAVLPERTFLLEVQLLTQYMPARTSLFVLRGSPDGSSPVSEVSATDYTQVVSAFWHTYRAAREAQSQ